MTDSGKQPMSAEEFYGHRYEEVCHNHTEYLTFAEAYASYREQASAERIATLESENKDLREMYNYVFTQGENRAERCRSAESRCKELREALLLLITSLEASKQGQTRGILAAYDKAKLLLLELERADLAKGHP